MKLSVALIVKNRLIEEIVLAERAFRTRVSWTEVFESEKPFDQDPQFNSKFKDSAKKAYDNWINLKNELATLKSEISKASVPINKDILELSELKDQLKVLKSFNFSWDKSDVDKKYGSDLYVTTFYNSLWNEEEYGNLRRSLQARIDIIQQKLDRFNHNTEIAFHSEHITISS